jgi:hypothetical protein
MGATYCPVCYQSLASFENLVWVESVGVESLWAQNGGTEPWLIYSSYRLQYEQDHLSFSHVARDPCQPREVITFGPVFRNHGSYLRPGSWLWSDKVLRQVDGGESGRDNLHLQWVNPSRQDPSASPGQSRERMNP